MSKKRRRFSPEFKFQVAMEYLTGKKRRVDILREYQLSDSTLERWCRQLQERGPQVFTGDEKAVWAAQERRIADLERLVGRLTMELDAAKKASDWLNSR